MLKVLFEQRFENAVLAFTGVLPGYIESVMLLEPHLSMQSQNTPFLIHLNCIQHLLHLKYTHTHFSRFYFHNVT